MRRKLPVGIEIGPFDSLAQHRTPLPCQQTSQWATMKGAQMNGFLFSRVSCSNLIFKLTV